MTVKDRIGNKYIRYGICFFLIFSLLISVIDIVSAEQIDHKSKSVRNKACTDCHTNEHQKNIGQNKKINTIGTVNKQSQPISTTGVLTGKMATDVIGNIILIPSTGQDWYQQGIFGPSSYGGLSDQSWGWTFFDENPSVDIIRPPEKVTQRNKVYALLLDSGNNSSPISGAQVSADVTYWTYNGTNYVSNLKTVQLTEEREGLYSGNFSFYGGSPSENVCGGNCHTFSADANTGYFPGTYNVSITASASGKTTESQVNFDVTAWGCEDCHGSGNRHRTGWVDLDSYCYLCHGINQIVHDGNDAGNPHQNTAHRSINCIDCHTNKNINPATFNGVTFDPLNKTPQYIYEVVGLNGGTHTSLTCTECHNDLTLPTIPGGYKIDNYTIQGTVNNYSADYSTIKQLQDYYVIDVDGRGGALQISLDWEGVSNIGFYLYPPNFDPDNRPSLYYDGSTSNKPETYNNNMPMTGKWVLAVYGYNLDYVTWVGTLQPPLRYIINSTYPIQLKGLPTIPECRTCHNSGGSGNAYTKYEVPDWNPGFAHADTNGDGNLDVQCRTCHNAMHNITVRNCQNCHVSPPTGHMIVEPKYSQYNASQCLLCHGDPHRVSAQAEGCVECHGIGYEGANPMAQTTLVNISLFNTSIHQNINDTVNKDYRVTNDDCWQCHYSKDMNRQNVRKCNYCHAKPSQWHGNATIDTNLTNLSIR